MLIMEIKKFLVDVIPKPISVILAVFCLGLSISFPEYFLLMLVSFSLLGLIYHTCEKLARYILNNAINV